MPCDNPAFYFVERGYSYKEVETRCGSTITKRGHVDKAFCDECANNKQKMTEHENRLRVSEEDNAWLASAGWGEI